MLPYRLLTFGILFLAILTTVLAYQPGLSGGFVLDDFHNIVQNDALQGDRWDLGRLVAGAMSTSAGPLGRPVAMFTFALDAWWHGLDPFYMKAGNLFLHCLTGILVFFLADAIIGQNQINFGRLRSKLPAVLAASIWLLHPIHASTVLYVVQRMAILSALFGCLSVLAYLQARRASDTRTALAWLIAHIGSLVLAVFSKESGLLIVPLILVLEGGVFRLRNNGQPVPVWVRRYVFMLSLICGAAAIYLVASIDSFLAGYFYREFSFTERVLTESRVLWHYISLVLAPIPHAFSIYKDGYSLSTGLFEPASTIFATLGWIIALAWVVWRLLRGPSLIAFGILWFLVGHALESTIFPLEIVFEHRNYFPSIGLIIAAVAMLGQLAETVVGSGSRRLLGTVVVGLLASCTFVVATYWSDPLEHALISVEQQPRSPRAQYAAGTMYYGLVREHGPVNDAESLMRYVDDAKQAEYHLAKAAELSPNSVAPLAQQIILFGDAPDAAILLDEMNKRLATARLRPAAGKHVLRLLGCFRRGDCPLDREILLDGIVAATKNQKAQTRERATFHLLAASLQAVEFDDRSAAAWHIEQAGSMMPNNRHIQANVRTFHD